MAVILNTPYEIVDNGTEVAQNIKGEVVLKCNLYLQK